MLVENRVESRRTKWRKRTGVKKAEDGNNDIRRQEGDGEIQGRREKLVLDEIDRRIVRAASFPGKTTKLSA